MSNEKLIAEARTASPGDDPTDLAVKVHTLADALEEAERERGEFKRLFSECHPVHLDGMKRAEEAERKIAAVERVTEKPVYLVRRERGYSVEDYSRPLVEVKELRAALSTPAQPQERFLDHEHKPVQHRDGKPPWCKVCGLTAQMQEPVSRFAAQPQEEAEGEGLEGADV